MNERFSKPVDGYCPQLAKQPEGGSCNKNNKCHYPKCMVMKMSDFYEKYWTVEGKPVPPLDPREKAIWDAAEELECSPYIKVWRRLRGWVYIINPLVQEELDKDKRYE